MSSCSGVGSSPRPTSPPSRSRAWRPSSPPARRCRPSSTGWPGPSTSARANSPADFGLTPRRPLVCGVADGEGWRRTDVDLFEYQGKQLLARFGVPVSPGEAVDTVDDAVTASERLGYPVVVKAQVQVGGRGKAGGIKLSNNAEGTRLHASNILGMDIKGHVVGRLWIEKASDIIEEYYASFTLDRAAKKHLGMVSAKGGVDIEAVAEEDPAAIARVHI